ncbi:MAG: SH3 domain-containing protein [Gemmatimonadales bacterium]
MRPLLLSLLLLLLPAGACRLPRSQDADAPVRPPPPPPPPPPPILLRDTALEQRAARLELRLFEKEAEVEELQSQLDDARREVVRAMAKVQSLATRAEAASGMAEAEIALQALRGGGSAAAIPEVGQAMQLLDLAATEFDRRNYAGALYLAIQAKSAAAAGRGRLAIGDRGTPRAGEIPFALPLRVETTERSNVRDGPGSGFAVVFTLDAGAPLIAYSHVDQWVRVTDDSGRPGWIFQGLIGRRR